MPTFLSVVSSLLVGVILTVAPWTPLWDANHLLQPYPSLRNLALSPYLRGLVSGLGLLNMVLAGLELRQSLAARRASPGA